MTNMDIDGLDAASSIAAIKASVAETFRSADGSVAVRATDYFNHTYAPDLVLEWPREGTSRRVYLRATSNVDYLLEDNSLIDEKASIIMPIGDSHTQEVDGDDGLNQKSHGSQVLVARPRCISRLGAGRVETPVVGLASRAVLQGGAGTLSEDKATTFGSAFADGFRGAQVGDADLTSEALEQAGAILDHKRNVQVEDFLHAVWVGSGVDTMTYPGEFRLDATLTTGGLELLLDTAEIDDEAFWRRIAGGLTMEVVEHLRYDESHLNFQRLLKAASARLKARSCRMVSTDSAHIATPAWYSNGEQLGIRIGTLDLLLTSKKLGDLSTAGVEQDIPVGALSERAATAGIELSEITIAASSRRLDYASADGTSIAGDERLDELGASMGRSSSVSRVVVQSTTPDLVVNFATSTAHGRSSSKFLIPRIVTNSVPLLWPMDENTREALAELTGDAPAEDSAEDLGDSGAGEISATDEDDLQS